jgi:cytochrome c peroxidase
VELTGPYGHDGSIVDLRAWVDHYNQAATKLQTYNPGQLEPLLQNTLLPTADQILLTRDFKLKTLTLAPETVDQITDFLKALTDPSARNLNGFVPLRVPSGLSVDGAP